MSAPAFHSELDLRAYTPGEWVVLAPLRYDAGDGEAFVVPRGFITDLASIPRVFRGAINQNGKSRKPAVLHDYLYCAQRTTRKEADDLFLEALGVVGVPGAVRWGMYLGVRAGGWVYWNKRQAGMGLAIEDFIPPGYFTGADAT